MNGLIYFLSACSFALVFISCDRNPTQPENDSNLLNTDVFSSKTTARFDHFAHDFGDIKEGQKVEHLFTFVNSGSKDLLIISAEGSCGCTVPEFPKDPVKPGESSQIKVVFNSKGRKGPQIKTVKVIANTNDPLTELIIKANVI
ncbi:MAG: DUF1573 domain-containing protein [Bacteroidia bacterium]|nr:DUF1573 domain-containing protein [Bacteroidia bacterium]